MPINTRMSRTALTEPNFVKKAKAAASRMKTPDSKAGMHPRNAHRAAYDFAALVQCSPELGGFVARNRFGNETIDFALPQAVKALNRALLKYFYHIPYWDIPEHYLCPPIPGRVDYLHYLADLIVNRNASSSAVRVLDIGVGANAIYPLLGHRVYGWHFVGADVDPVALQSAKNIVENNEGFAQAIELRLQHSADNIFAGIIQPNECFELAMCNPPFHRSPDEAAAGSERKWRNLAKNRELSQAVSATKTHQKNKRSSNGGADMRPTLNFGGKSNELWCEGGEALFLQRMITQSETFAPQCRWFTSLVSKEEHLPALLMKLKSTAAKQVKTISMQQGQKQSRILAWSFFSE